MGQFFSELKRRNVIRVAIAYLVAAWVVLQVADLVLDNIGAPGWVMQAFMLALGLGFPLILVFSWAFELTTEGIKREKDVERNQSVTAQTARRLDRLVIGLLVVVLAILAVERFAPGVARPSMATSGDDGQVAEANDKSIAVLAFDDLSPGGDQEYFAEGISEELLNVLAQIPDLKVAGRTSSFAFKDQKRDLREIGEILGVAHILEGSVRTAGQRVRVTAQLIKAEDGFHLFSKSYDSELTDIFEVQDDIAREIGIALRSAILGDTDIEMATPTSVEAYDRYLRARQWIHTRDRQLMEQASDLLDEALELDPDYAPGLAQKALVTILLSDAPGAYGDIPWQFARDIARPLLDRALSIEPDLAEAHAVFGLWYSSDTIGLSADAARHLRRALEISPTMANANNWLASQVSDGVSIGAERQLYEAVIEHDPLYAPAFNNLTFAYLQTRDLDKADALIRRVQRITGDSPSVHFARGTMAMATGDLSTAIGALGEAYEFNPSASIVRLWFGAATYLIGDYDRSAVVSLETDALVPLELSGQHEAAVALLESSMDKLLNEGQWRGISDWYLLQDRAAELIELHATYFEGRNDWADIYPKPEQLWGAAAHTRLALALHQVGRAAEGDAVLQVALETLEAQHENGADNLFFWFNDAEAGALTGDRARMLRSLRNAIDTGYLDVLGIASPAFESFRGDARLLELENEMIRRANEERRELGLLGT